METVAVSIFLDGCLGHALLYQASRLFQLTRHSLYLLKTVADPVAA